MRIFDLNNAALIINGVVDDAGGVVLFEAKIGEFPPYMAGLRIIFSIGEREMLVIPADRHADMTVRSAVPVDELRSTHVYDIALRDQNGADATEMLNYALTGPIFDALFINSTQEFFDRIQLNHSRFKSPIMLEIGARSAYERFNGDFRVQAAALTIISHRFLEMPVSALKAEDQRVTWLLEQASEVIARGEGLINGPDVPEWIDARWTISLATVAGYLSLIGDRYTRAEKFFAIPVRYVGLVKIAKVSALNIVNGCFIHGMLSHVLGRNDVAKASLTTGVQSIPTIVAAQNLMENVWVIGDLMNVMRSARQCFIALIRLKLMDHSSPATGPIINNAHQILTSDVVGPLHDILLGGRAALLARVVAASGGTI